MPTSRKTTNPTPTGPVKKAAAPRKRRTTTAEPKAAQGIAAKRAQVLGEDRNEVDPYAPTAWGADDTRGRLIDLELPSGQLCLAQKPGPEDLMAAGLLDDFDTLATALPKKGGRPTAAGTQLMKNPAMMQKAMALMDRVVLHVVIKPELTPEPEKPADRVVGNIYPSSISLEDKTFIMQWALGGTRDLERFRGEREALMAGVDALTDDEGEAE